MLTPKLFALVFAATIGAPAFAQASAACVNKAFSALRQDSPIGYKAATSAQTRDNMTAFMNCAPGEFYLSVPTAVHETVHMIRSEKNAYLMASGELQPVPDDSGLYAPKKMAANLVRDLKINTRDDIYYGTYVAPKGDASSRNELSYLMDELNAYTVDLKVSTDFANKGRHPVNPQNHGQPALMAYLAYYMKHAQSSEPATFQRIMRDPATRNAIRNVWSQAETTLSNACGSPNQGTDPDGVRNYVSFLCDGSGMSAMTQVIGRRSQCPTTCRGGKGAVVAEPRSDERYIILPADEAAAR